MIDELAYIEKSRNPEYLVMPPYTHGIGKVTIDKYTEISKARQIALAQKGLDLNEIQKQMVEGIDYTRSIVDYVPYVEEVKVYQRPRYRFLKGNKPQTRK